MYTLLNGKELSKKIKKQIAREVADIIDKGLRSPSLAVILVGNDEASETYVRNKIKATKKTGIISHEYKLDENVSEKELIEIINFLNNDDDVDGILVQLPLPKHINESKILNLISPEKDVDGFTVKSTGKLYKNQPSLKPCTPLGIMEFFKEYKIELKGKHAVVVGRSDIVGKPIANMLLQKDATVTICHSKTQNLKDFIKAADILVSAVGKAEFIKEDWIKDGAVVIDVGINYKEDGKLVGDVDFENVAPKCSYITPVPKGVGPMTIAMLMKNCLTAYKTRLKK